MNDIWSAYFKMFEKHTNNIQSIKHKSNMTIIKEDDDDDTDDDTDDDDDDTDTDDEEDDDQTDENDEQQNNDQSISDKEQSNKKSANLNFSADLAAQFGNTCNKFTNLAAKVVKERTVPKETADDLNKILDKLKSLIDAANNSI